MELAFEIILGIFILLVLCLIVGFIETWREYRGHKWTRM